MSSEGGAQSAQEGAGMTDFDLSEPDGFVNAIVERTPEHYDGDDAAEWIALRYVRDLEALAEQVKAMVPAMNFNIRQYVPGFAAHWQPVAEALATVYGLWDDDNLLAADPNIRHGKASASPAGLSAQDQQ